MRLCDVAGCSKRAGHPPPCDQLAPDAVVYDPDGRHHHVAVDPNEWLDDFEESTPLVFSDDPRAPAHLRSDCPMVECYRCRRQSVREVAGIDQVNVACAMTQPDGSTCPGRFIALTYPLGAS